MSVNKVQFGNLYGVNAIRQAQSRPANVQYSAVKDRELHPVVNSTELAKTPFANKLDLLA